MKVGLVIPIYNRPDYVRRCFDSLEKLTVKPYMLIIVDDASDKETAGMLSDFTSVGDVATSQRVLWQQKNKGVRAALLRGIDEAFAAGADLVINLDSDAIVKPDFIERLVSLHNESRIVSGFNCGAKHSPILKQYKGYATKEHLHGINMCFNKAQYQNCIKPTLDKVGNWDFNSSNAMKSFNYERIVVTPSVVQHIGLKSSMGHVGADVADDFKILSLPDVTLFAADSRPEGIKRAAAISQHEIDFGDVKIITKDFGKKPIEKYSEFMLKELTNHFTTSHVLVIQHDGYVMNANAWQDEWLQYDYIGATWWYKDNMNVGNGGFSLRSKKLCDILADNDIEPNLMHPEDHCICRHYRQSLERDFGIKFAPEEVANKFSIEGYNTPARHYTGQFGFHSQHVDFSNSEIPEDWRLKPILKQTVIKRR